MLEHLIVSLLELSQLKSVLFTLLVLLSLGRFAAELWRSLSNALESVAKVLAVFVLRESQVGNDYQSRWREEWQAELLHIPGPAAKLSFITSLALHLAWRGWPEAPCGKERATSDGRVEGKVFAPDRH
jgi:hypothetical protein